MRFAKESVLHDGGGWDPSSRGILSLTWKWRQFRWAPPCYHQPGGILCGVRISSENEEPISIYISRGACRRLRGLCPTEESSESRHRRRLRTRLTSYSNLVPQAGAQMVQAGLKLAKSMKPGTLPEKPKAAQLKEAWFTEASPPSRITRLTQNSIRLIG